MIHIKYIGDTTLEPRYQSEGAAGADVISTETFLLRPGERHLFSTGLFLEIPHGYECQIRPRSGLALKHGVTVLNSPGTIDHDYRGEIKVLLVNLGTAAMSINKGDRIAQLVFSPVTRASFQLVKNLSDSIRGLGGFGSTG